jgi:hypothetical protein
MPFRGRKHQTTTKNLLPPNTNPDRRNLPSGACLPAGGKQPPVWGCAPGLGPPGNAMTLRHGEEDLAPGVNQGGLLPGYMGEAAPSLQRRETLTAGDKSTLPIEGKGVKYYADIHRTKKNTERYRITFTTDGVSFKHVDSFEDIPAKSGDKIYIDTLPLKHTDGAIELLRRGVELYCLRRLTLVGKKREELKLPKTTRGDIRTLMGLEERWFRKLSEDFLIMRRLISAYRTMLKTHQQYLNRYRAVSEKERSGLKPVIDVLEKQMNIMAEEIAEEACRRYPAYNKLVEELGIDGKVSAMEALAELVVYLDPMKGFRKTVNLLGLFKRIRGRKKIYDGRLRRALQRLTVSTNNILSLRLTARMEKEILAKIWRTYRQET